MNGHDAFERSLQQALGNYEVPYNSADWSQLEKRLDGSRPPLLRPTAALYVLMLGGAIASFTTIRALVDEPVAAHDEGTGMMALVDDVATPIIEDNTLHAGDSTSDEPTSADKAAPASEHVAKPAAAPPNGEVQRPDPTRTEAVVAEPARKEASIKANITEGCPGTEIAFATENMDKNGMHLWNFGDGSFSNKADPVHKFTKPGNYKVMLSHSASGGGTIQNRPASDPIVIHEAPEAAFDHVRREYDNTVPTVHFENRSQGGRVYAWDFGDGGTSNVAHPDHVFKKQGIYTVQLEVTNGKGCVDRITKEIRIDRDYELLASKSFSPNGDGIDDLFMPEALKTLGVAFHLSVFDAASGTLVYETTDPTRAWNGRLNNKGEACTPGDYTWMVDMKDGEKLGGTYSGTVNLLR